MARAASTCRAFGFNLVLAKPQVNAGLWAAADALSARQWRGGDCVTISRDAAGLLAVHVALRAPTRCGSTRPTPLPTTRPCMPQPRARGRTSRRPRRATTTGTTCQSRRGVLRLRMLGALGESLVEPVADVIDNGFKRRGNFSAYGTSRAGPGDPLHIYICIYI